MLGDVLMAMDKRIDDEGYDSFTMEQNMEKIACRYEKFIDSPNEVKKEFLKEQFGTQFTETQYDLIVAFTREVFSVGYSTGYFDGIADERERQDW